MAYNKSIQYELLKDKSVIVTGGVSGLGLATATRFAEHGAYVTLADMNQQLGEKVVADLSSRNLKVSFVRCDVTNWESSIAAFKHAVNFSPSKTLDVAALFAGVGGHDKNIFDEVAAASLTQDPERPSTLVLDVNLTGEYLSAWLALHYFRLKPEEAGAGEGTTTAAAAAAAAAQSSKSLILVASLAGYIDFNGSSQYAMSKYGVRGLFRNLRKRIKDPSTKVRCNVICPGYTKTEMTENMWDQDRLWAPVKHVVDASSLCAVDETVNGRAFCTLADGFHDMNEDLDKGWAGQTLADLMKSSGYASHNFC